VGHAADPTGRLPVDGVLVDLLMAVMDSLAVWSAAAGEQHVGLRWRDAVTARMVATPSYVPYEELVAAAAAEVGLPPPATSDLLDRWPRMAPWPDAAALSRLTLPFAFLTNCSAALARTAARRSRLLPRFTLSAEEAGRYKPDTGIYRKGCRRLRTAPEHTLFIAGSPYDAEGARAAGLWARLVLRRAGQRIPDATIPVATSLEEIVDRIVDPGG
jgi:2-haloacid dehalogenase